jgi:two-component system OmpR family response regulator
MTRICKVLVVDDHDDVRDILGMMVGYAGYRFTLARDAKEARKAIDREEFDVAIIDATLPPPENGVRLAEFAEERGIGVIMISGEPTQIARLQQGRHAHLIKPFRVSAMLALVDAVLGEVGAGCQSAPEGRSAVGGNP